MKRSAGKRKSIVFWAGVILLCLFWLAFIPVLISGPTIGNIIMIMIFTAFSVGVIILGIWLGRKEPGVKIEVAPEPSYLSQPDVRPTQTLDNKQSASSRFKQVAKFVLPFILLALFLWVFYEAWWRWGELRPASAAETILFNSGVLELIGSAFLTMMGLVMVLISVAIAMFDLPSKIKKCLQERSKSRIKELTGHFFVFLILLIGGAAFAWLNGYDDPCSQKIAIDKSAQVISIENQYFFREGKDLRIQFDEIGHVAYHYSPGSVGQYGTSPSGSVEIIKLNGAIVKVSHDGPKAQYELAKAIAQVTGKELIEEGK